MVLDIVNQIKSFLNLSSSKEEFSAVYESDIRSLLQSLELLEEVQNGEWQCYSCECQVSVDSIGKICGEYDELVLFCDSYTCMYDTFRDPQDQIPEKEINYDIDEKWTPEGALTNIDIEYRKDEEEDEEEDESKYLPLR